MRIDRHAAHRIGRGGAAAVRVPKPMAVRDVIFVHAGLINLPVIGRSKKNFAFSATAAMMTELFGFPLPSGEFS
jgi:hypothetical protein